MSVSSARDGSQIKSWSARYGERHKLLRINTFPPGINAPKKVRIYARMGHYVLQAWDPATKRTISDRIDGDLLHALIRARELDERIVNYRRTGNGASRLTHEGLVKAYVGDLRQRAEAGEIDPKTVQRYQTALQHYLNFVGSGDQHIPTEVRHVDRQFQRALAARLRQLTVTANGRPKGARNVMRRSDYVLDVVRAMYLWAADPQRGALLCDGFVNPFLRSAETGRPVLLHDPTEEPSITSAMAADFLRTCDAWQLPVFAGLALWGLRPSELCWLFQEHATTEWLHVRCLPELEYLTKGRRDKRLPLLSAMVPLWMHPGTSTVGLLFRARSAMAMRPRSLADLTSEYRQRVGSSMSVDQRRELRDQLLRETGGVTYDGLEAEFHRIARTLGWPRSATMKGFRHLFATCLENGGMPEFYRRYLMGQSPGRSAIVTYTHLNQVREQYTRIVEAEFPIVLETISRRRLELQIGLVVPSDS